MSVFVCIEHAHDNNKKNTTPTIGACRSVVEHESESMSEKAHSPHSFLVFKDAGDPKRSDRERVQPVNPDQEEIAKPRHRYDPIFSIELKKMLLRFFEHDHKKNFYEFTNHFTLANIDTLNYNNGLSGLSQTRYCNMLICGGVNER